VIESAGVDGYFVPVPNPARGTHTMPGRVLCWGWRLLWKVVARTPEIIQISKGCLRAGEADDSCSTKGDGGDDWLSEVLFHVKGLFMVYIVYDISLDALKISLGPATAGYLSLPADMANSVDIGREGNSLRPCYAAPDASSQSLRFAARLVCIGSLFNPSPGRQCWLSIRSVHRCARRLSTHSTAIIRVHFVTR
jgi:hypothetical protein